MELEQENAKKRRDELKLQTASTDQPDWGTMPREEKKVLFEQYKAKHNLTDAKEEEAINAGTLQDFLVAMGL